MNELPEVLGSPRSQRDPPASAHRPWVTWIMCGVSVVVFLGLTQEANPDTWEALERWGAASPNRIWEGAYWSLVSSALVHRAIWHLAFNLYWLGKGDILKAEADFATAKKLGYDPDANP